jgi:uncharacterized protein YciI
VTIDKGNTGEEGGATLRDLQDDGRLFVFGRFEGRDGRGRRRHILERQLGEQWQVR